MADEATGNKCHLATLVSGVDVAQNQSLLLKTMPANCCTWTRWLLFTNGSWMDENDVLSCKCIYSSLCKYTSTVLTASQIRK